MRKVNIWIAALFLLAAPAVVFGSTVKSGENVTIDETVEGNLYVAGGELYIKAPIQGDLIAGGGKISVNDTVLDDGLVAGGEITINAEVKGDFRIGGGKVLIRRNIQGDLVVLGGEIVVEEGVVIGGDLMVLGGEIDLRGTVNGKIMSTSGKLRFSGQVLGGLEYKGGELALDGEVNGPARISAREIKLGSNALFFSDVRYWREGGEMDFSDHLQNGATATFDTSLKSDFGKFNKKKIKQGLFLFSVYRFMAGILLIFLLVSLFHNFFSRHSGKLPENMVSSFGYGMAYLFGLPVLIILAFITLIGIPVGFVLAAGYGISLALAGALVSVILAYELKKYLNKDWTKGMMILIAAGLSLAIRFVDLIPVLGSLVLFIMIAIIFGYLYQNIQRDRELRRPPMDSDIV